MYRTKTCGELRLANVGETVTLAGWVQKCRKLGGMTFIDLRDRYGITQLVVEASAEEALSSAAASLGREYVIQATGKVVERASKNPKMETGDIEIVLSSLKVLNKQIRNSDIVPKHIISKRKHHRGNRQLILRRERTQRQNRRQHHVCLRQHLKRFARFYQFREIINIG